MVKLLIDRILQGGHRDPKAHPDRVWEFLYEDGHVFCEGSALVSGMVPVGHEHLLALNQTQRVLVEAILEACLGFTPHRSGRIVVKVYLDEGKLWVHNLSEEEAVRLSDVLKEKFDLRSLYEYPYPKDPHCWHFAKTLQIGVGANYGTQPRTTLSSGSNGNGR